MRKNLEIALLWIEKGDHDLNTAEILKTHNGHKDNIAFHCQQAIEKYLKGFLSYHSEKIPYTHDLNYLGKLCSDVDQEIIFNNEYLAEITSYAVEIRYDLFEVLEEDSIALALKYVIEIKEQILSRLK